MIRRYADLSPDEKLDLMADLLDPIATIFTNEDVVKAYKTEESRPVDWVKAALKCDHKSVFEILAAFDGIPVEEYQFEMADPLIRIGEIFQNAELKSVFPFAGPKTDGASSGSATENAGEG